MAFRQLKQQIRALLAREDLNAALNAIVAMPLRQVINPLFGLLYDGNTLVRWHSITAMGVVTARLAIEQMEAARIIMRRLMWNLNDESGGIGWGSPEAMGEIMARYHPLAREYGAILISYLNPKGNYLEHEGLQQGTLWAIGRLAQEQLQLTIPAAQYLTPFIASPRDDLRGMAVWTAGFIPMIDSGQALQQLCSDNTRVELFQNGQLKQQTIADLAKNAITILTKTVLE